MKMKHIVFCLLIFALCLNPLFAETRIFDNAGILKTEEKAALEKMMEDIASAYNFGLIILIEKSIGTAEAAAYSAKFLDSMGLDGYEWDGCIFLQSAEGRDYDITASGRGSKILNNTAFNKLEKDVVTHLHQDDYYGAYVSFINNWKEFLVLESQGRSYNFLRPPVTHAVLTGSVWLLGLLVGFFTVRGMKAKMNTALPKTEADTYIIPDSLVITNQQDRFLYSTVTKTRRQSSSSSGSRSSSGGRSSRSGKY